jgi:hypothetical protein
MSPWVNVRGLKFFEERDVDLVGPDEDLVLPLISPVADDHDPRYEVDKIDRREILVWWLGWVRRSVLEEDVPTLVLAYDANPSIFVSRKSVTKRARKGSPDMVSPDVRRSSRST